MKREKLTSKKLDKEHQGNKSIVVSKVPFNEAKTLEFRNLRSKSIAKVNTESVSPSQGVKNKANTSKLARMRNYKSNKNTQKSIGIVIFV